MILKSTLAVALLVPSIGNAQMFRDIPESEANINPSTTYRKEIQAHLRSTLRDPFSVRDAQISQPALKWMGAGNRYVVCIRFNTKNAFGGWTGPRDYMAIYVRGRLSGIDEPIMGQCREVTYERFTELEKLR